MEIKERVAALRKLMEREGIDAYMIPSTDAHHSEYLPKCWKRREWISGFTGSAGDVVITSDKGGLWTDGRYFLQAEEQLAGSGIDLFKMTLPDVPTLEEWVAKELKKGQKMGIDPKLLSVESARKLARALKERDVLLEYIESNLVDELWLDRPRPSRDPVIVLSEDLTGESVEEKLLRIREKMEDKLCNAHILGALDTIAWTFNIRGTDIDFNPLVISYAVITMEKAHLFLDKVKITEKMKGALQDLVEFHAYDEVGEFISKLRGRVWINPKTESKWIALNIESDTKVHMERSPITDMKSVKNEVELQGFRDCLVVDGVAMVKYLKWLEEEVPKGGVTEISAANRLKEFRKEGDKFAGLSFTTISGFGEHGAIIHYDCTPETDVELGSEGIYLVDSGGQYLNGTTDITRTIAFGKPTDEQKEMFTRVLKGHIGLSTLRFPKGFSGKQIELPARKALWDAGKNYNHGTGHGVGHYLNVHEGPMGITPRDIGVPLKPGNVLSNEPGYYKAGEYGIRIENLIVVLDDDDLSSDEFQFLKFETLTMCPIDLNLVDMDLLNEEERTWLNEYHKEIYARLSPLLDDDHENWLEEHTRGI
ncbi:MAG: aminopeptidase P family protein [Candidatus Thermoplasmatota archaeon]|nr:aminopeptidase P family protein [Candidatus Thermoplasmatota archaeon]